MVPGMLNDSLGQDGVRVNRVVAVLVVRFTLYNDPAQLLSSAGMKFVISTGSRTELEVLEPYKVAISVDATIVAYLARICGIRQALFSVPRTVPITTLILCLFVASQNWSPGIRK